MYLIRGDLYYSVHLVVYLRAPSYNSQKQKAIWRDKEPVALLDICYCMLFDGLFMDDLVRLYLFARLSSGTFITPAPSTSHLLFSWFTFRTNSNSFQSLPTTVTYLLS